MSWRNIYQVAVDANCELLLLDSCLAALSHSTDAVLHARLTAEIPDAQELCTALDEHGIPITDEVEARIVMRHRFVELKPPLQLPLTLGVRATA